MKNHVNRFLALLGVSALVAVLGCSVTVETETGEDGQTTVTFSIANKSFSLDLGPVGKLLLFGDGVPVQSAGNVVLFDDVSQDVPSSAVIELDIGRVQVAPIAIGKPQAAAQLVSGTVSIRLLIGGCTSTNPCVNGIDIGTFELLISDNAVSTADSSLEMSPAALAFAVTGRFTICFEATASMDLDLTIPDLSCVFGPPIDGDGCISDGDCLGGFVCTAQTCVPSTTTDCAVDSECGADETCVGGECTTTSTSVCTNDSECGTGEVCQNGLCTAVPSPSVCIDDSDCGAAEVCDGGTCVAATPAGCTVDADCDDGSVCVDAACVAADTSSLTFVQADILHRGSEKRVAGPDVTSSVGTPTPAGYGPTSIALSGDGQVVWFVLYDQFPDVEGDPQYQLWNVETDGAPGSRSDMDPSHVTGGLTVVTNLTGSLAVIESGFASSVFARATKSNPTELIVSEAPCARGTIKLSDDGATILYSSFCSSSVHSIDLLNFPANPVQVAAPESFNIDGFFANTMEIGEFDMASNASTWVASPRIFDVDQNRNRPIYPVGTGLSGPIVQNQTLPRDDERPLSFNMTDAGTTIGYCIPNGQDGTLGACYVQDVGSDVRTVINDTEGLYRVERMVLADDGSRVYASLPGSAGHTYGFFQEVGSTEKIIGGTNWSSSDPYYSNAQLSDDGTVLAAPRGTGVYVLKDGVDGLPGFPTVDGISYAYDDENDTLMVRCMVTTLGTIDRVYLFPMYHGIDPFQFVADDENPFFRDRFGSTGFVEVEDGVWEHTTYLDGKKSFIDAAYRLRVIVVDGNKDQAVFQDFSPMP